MSSSDYNNSESFGSCDLCCVLVLWFCSTVLQMQTLFLQSDYSENTFFYCLGHLLILARCCWPEGPPQLPFNGTVAKQLALNLTWLFCDEYLEQNCLISLLNRSIITSPCKWMSNTLYCRIRCPDIYDHSTAFLEHCWPLVTHGLH